MPPLFAADKPAGVNAAAFAAYLSRREGRPLFPCHDLEERASGALLLAPAENQAQVLRQAPLQRRYLLLGTRAPDRGCMRERRGRFGLWEVEREEPGPMPGEALLLHLAELRLGDHRHAAPPPLLCHHLEYLEDADLRAWLLALDRRQRLFSLEGETTARLVHDECAHIRCDRLGPTCWFYWYRPAPPSAEDLQRMDLFARLSGCAHWRAQAMQNRGRDPQARRQWGSQGLAEWVGSEHGVRYFLRADQGLSPGLFLDQRANRLWALQQARGQRFLNLFSYTGGFSLCAALGGAAEVVSVDASRAYLEWSKANFALNGLEVEKAEFWAADARYFLRGCRRRGRLFDCIVCDPPSFARGPRGPFRIERDLGELIALLLGALAPGGQALVSSNCETWKAAAFAAEVGRAAGAEAELAEVPPPDWDYELPGNERRLKAVRLIRS